MSCLEMAQNSARLVWSREKVDGMLKNIMHNIYDSCEREAKELGDEVRAIFVILDFFRTLYFN